MLISFLSVLQCVSEIFFSCLQMGIKTFLQLHMAKVITSKKYVKNDKCSVYF